jgi:hypothetical protein
MTTQKVLLRVVFGSLALAAVVGAGAVIFAGHDTLWRIVGTCFATAAGALLLYWCSGLVAAGATRRPGWLATVLVLLEYLLTLAQIWEVFGRAEEQAALTMLYLAITGIPAIVFLALERRPAAAVAVRVGLAVCAAVLALLLIAVWSPGLGTIRFEDNAWFELSRSLAAYGFLAVLALLGAGSDRRHWRWAGVAAAAAGLVLATRETLLDVQRTSDLLVCVATVAVVVAHANAMMQCRLRPGQRWLLAATIAASVATGLFVDLGRLTEPWQGEILGRLAGAAAIIAGCGTLALLVLARLNRDLPRPGLTAGEVRAIALTCPLCGAKQTIPIGEGRCSSCGIGIAVRLERSAAP